MLAIKLEFTTAVLALAAAGEDTSSATFSAPGSATFSTPGLLATAVVVANGVCGSFLT